MFYKLQARPSTSRKDSKGLGYSLQFQVHIIRHWASHFMTFNLLVKERWWKYPTHMSVSIEAGTALVVASEPPFRKLQGWHWSAVMTGWLLRWHLGLKSQFILFVCLSPARWYPISFPLTCCSVSGKDSVPRTYTQKNQKHWWTSRSCLCFWSNSAQCPSCPGMESHL